MMPAAKQLISQLKNGSSSGVETIGLNVTMDSVRSEIIEASQPEKVDRCVYLLEHIGSCKNVKTCVEGEGCLRTRKVMFHYLNCPNAKAEEKCSICLQLLALCQIHSERCQNHETGCPVLNCRNRKQNDIQSKEPVSSVNLTREQYNHMVKLGKALRMSSSDEKKRILLELIKGDQRGTAMKLFRDLYKLKKARAGANQVVPTWPANRQAAPTCGREVLVPSGVQMSGKKINSVTMYNGRIVIRNI